jgi:glycosyl-4,4'-diaponeurosporenoate acyltransferase
MQPSKGRDVLVLVLVTAALAGSLVLLHKAVGVASPWFGLALMLDVTGVAAFARPVFPLRMPGFLRKPRAWEARGSVYKALRVPGFGVMLRRTALRHLNSNVYLDQRRDLAAVIANVEHAEAAHFYAAVVLLPWIAIAHLRGNTGAALILWAVQLVYNVYPMLHLRWVRFRLGKLGPGLSPPLPHPG